MNHQTNLLYYVPYIINIIIIYKFVMKGWCVWDHFPGHDQLTSFGTITRGVYNCRYPHFEVS